MTLTAPPESLNYLKEKIHGSEGCLKEIGHHPVRNSEMGGRMQRWQSLIFFFPSSHQRKFILLLLPAHQNVFSSYRKHLSHAPNEILHFKEKRCDFSVTGDMKSLIRWKCCWTVCDYFNTDEYVSSHILIRIKLSFLPGLGWSTESSRWKAYRKDVLSYTQDLGPREKNMRLKGMACLTASLPMPGL